MSPQPSNRRALLEGALNCLTRMPLEQVSARAVAGESGANIASINYHFGSKDLLVTAAVVEGLDRWLANIDERLEELPAARNGADRFQRAAEAIDATRDENEGIARAFVVALARAHHDDVVADHLTEGFLHTRPRVAEILGLGADQTGADAGALVHAMFTGLLAQALLSPDLILDSDRTVAALRRLASVIIQSSPEAACEDDGETMGQTFRNDLSGLRIDPGRRPASTSAALRAVDSRSSSRDSSE